MVQRLNVREGQTPEAARKRFDGQLGVPAWETPGHEAHEPEPGTPWSPWWWSGAEDASQDFLKSMGVNLT